MKDACPKCDSEKDIRSKQCKRCASSIAGKAGRGISRNKGTTAWNKGGKQSPEWIEKRCQSRGYRQRDVRYPIHLNSQERRAKQLWAKSVKSRDKSCLICGSDDRLHAHHILSSSKHPEISLILNNGITLCHQCHWDEHRLNGTL